MSTVTSPRTALEHADRLLRDVVPGTRGMWPRCCAWLLRLALERALDDYWATTNPPVRDCSRRAQLLALARYLATDDAEHITQVWNDLSRASHHHAYELAPTAGELRRWHADVDHAIGELADLTALRPDVP
jgi:hypothetical protein